MPRKESEKGTVVGYGTCPTIGCGHEGPYRVNKSGRLYFFCARMEDGGCGNQTQPRQDRGEEMLAEQVKRWTKPEYRARFIDGEYPAPADDPAPKDPPPADDQAAEGEDAEILPPPVPVPGPVPPRRRAAAPAPARQAPAPARKKSGGIFAWED